MTNKQYGTEEEDFHDDICHEAKKRLKEKE